MPSPALGPQVGVRAKSSSGPAFGVRREGPAPPAGPRKLTPSERRERVLHQLQAAAQETGLPSEGPPRGAVGVQLASRMRGPPICPGCGVQMQDKQPALPGYFRRPKEEPRAEEERLAARVRPSPS